MEGERYQGTEIGIRIDQTLTQDATGTMAYLQLEALGIDGCTELSVSYVDHNTPQAVENADDHRYLQSVAARYGIYFSRPGNGFAIRSTSNGSAFPARRCRLGHTLHRRRPGHAGHRGMDVAVAMAAVLLPGRAVGLARQPCGNPPPWVERKIFLKSCAA